MFSLSEITSLFDLSRYLDRSLHSCKLSKSEVAQCFEMFLGLLVPLAYSELAMSYWLSIVPSHRCDVCAAALMVRPPRLYDVTALLRLKRCGCNILEKVKFSQTDNLPAISDLAYSTAPYNMGLNTKFCSRTSCHLEVIGSRSSQLLYRLPLGVE